MDTSYAPKQIFLLFYSRYNGHRGRTISTKMINTCKLERINLSVKLNNQGVFALISRYFNMFSSSLFLTDFRLHADSLDNILSSLARKDCLAISLPIIRSSSLAKHICLHLTGYKQRHTTNVHRIGCETPCLLHH